MSKAYCIDVSGSMSEEDCQKAFAFVKAGMEPGDHLIVFDIDAMKVTPGWIKNPCAMYGRGGTDATKCLELVKQLGCYSSILISDGYMAEDQLVQFTKFVDIREL